MRVYQVSETGIDEAYRILRRSNLQDNAEVETTVRDIIAQVRAYGDTALLELSRRFDSPLLADLEVSEEEWDRAEGLVPDAVKIAIQTSAANISAFHEKQKKTSWLDSQPDRVLGQLIRPLDRVGVYVPGGTASYPSTVLMTVVPAYTAGVREIVLCSPARKNGTVDPLVLYAAKIAGVKRIFTIGGAQAVAAMAFGTKCVPAVDKIVGPGNVYVNVAKKLLWGVVDIDMLAGPSEVCVVADAGANPRFAALDMLTQAEHDTESAAFLITPSIELARLVEQEIDLQLQTLPRREILKKALDKSGAIIVSESMDQAFDLANAAAPEHLALMVRDPLAALGHIKNAGAVLMGDYSPQTLGDYMAGPSHTLPTSGTARFASPLHVDTFLKKSSFIYYTQSALRELAAPVTAFARAEGFEAHAAAVEARLE